MDVKNNGLSAVINSQRKVQRAFIYFVAKNVCLRMNKNRSRISRKTCGFESWIAELLEAFKIEKENS